MKRMRQRLGFLFSQLQIRIIVSLVLLVFIAVFISLNISFKHTELLFEQETAEVLSGNLEQTGSQVEMVSLDMLKLTNLFGMDDVIIESLNDFDRDEAFKPFARMKDASELTSKDYTRVSKIENHLYYAKNNTFFNYDAQIAVISADGLISMVKGNIGSTAAQEQTYAGVKRPFGELLMKQPAFQTLASQERNMAWTVPIGLQASPHGREEPYVSLARTIKSSFTGELLGMFVINVNLDNLVSLFKVRDTETIFLLDDEDRLITSYGSEALKNIDFMKDRLKLYGTRKGYFLEQSDGKKYIVNYYVLNRLHWTLVSAIPYEDVMKNTRDLKSEVLAINYVVFGLFLALSIASIIYMTNPLRLLIHQLKKKKIGVYSLGTQDTSLPSDVYGIVKSFEHLFRRVDELVMKVVRDERREQEMKYETLKAQINPHFLLNTLNIIKWTAMINGATPVSTMISDLGKLLEVSMNRGGESVTIAEEMQLLQAYMNIQNARFNDGYEFRYRIEPPLEQYSILKLLLQPLVENSILHGLKNKKVGGTIDIEATLTDGIVRIDVKDNGEGIPPGRLDDIWREDAEGREQLHKFNGIGLRNIHDRLRIKYGEPFGLSIASSPGEGTTVTVLLPAEKSGEPV
ncbi:Histidine kinase-, DNA gyrase B-, and HSP90-like ATPase [Paenibacillus sp. UNCCL117]|uniref:cache domain-containing sensor histidine kinase n=1 Tax=unclassified Paenibacillus TaxID=185978 RepID=UPI0008900CF0|nr:MULTISPECIES: sensor histidine kinase [unclassified Paenibacillus]SDD06264.1 Histidine kinase-, DNA gyrase B-, and HSP90-like ATPase [Paenibacillus sp. cl123]SFW31731.1 Histidine kinase-, DNA gyrase B-, and HSP90-like ATPase [Paenibacillus sp. UNCCL117]